MPNPKEVLEHMRECDERANAAEVAQQANFNTEYTDAALRLVISERQRQVGLGHEGKIPHPCEDPDTDWGYRLGVLLEEVGEVSTELIEGRPWGEGMLKECVQTAAVALACVEGSMRQLGMKSLPRHSPHTKVGGKCPACGSTALMVDDYGTIVCSWAKCPDPGMISELLEEGLPKLDDHMQVLLRANRIRNRRNAEYKDMWKNYGWRGALTHLRTCAERAFISLWSAPPGATVKVDNLLDAINYAAFAVRAIDEGNRDGTWRYPEEH